MNRPARPVSARMWVALAVTHRWFGVAGCLLFVSWFVSGIAMVYVRMPELTPRERLAGAAPIDAPAVLVGPGEAQHIAGAAGEATVVLEMLGARPVYRIGTPPVTVFADTGERLTAVPVAAATATAAAYAGAPVRHLGAIELPDQWTLQLRQHLPLHRVVVDDPTGTELYVSSRTGAVVLDTTRHERVWAYVGPVAHWLYLPLLRRNGPLWTQVIIWSSALGCVLCVTGLIAGVWRLGRRGRSPYAGWLRWHHHAGLLFGVVTSTWTFSGLLSMGPFAWLSDQGPTPEQRRALSGDRPALDAVTPGDVRRALAALGVDITPKELRLVTFEGHLHWLAIETPGRQRLVSARDPSARPIVAFAAAAIETAVRRAAGPAAAVEWLTAYDEYYYDRSGQRPLPVARVRDGADHWLYVDPARGDIVLSVGPRDRLNRWLYNGLHSLDPRWLRDRRPLWDAVVILLSLGGLAGAVTSLVPAWRRVVRVTRGVG